MWMFLRLVTLKSFPFATNDKVFVVIYQTLETVFHPISKHREEIWKYDAQRSIFDEIYCVRKSDETLYRVFDESIVSRGWKRVFHRISKHREESWKYDASRSILDDIRGDWKSDETLSRVFDIPSQFSIAGRLGLNKFSCMEFLFFFARMVLCLESRSCITGKWCCFRRMKSLKTSKQIAKTELKNWNGR